MSFDTGSHETKDLDFEEKGGFQTPAPVPVASNDDGIQREGSKGVIGWLWKVSKKLDSYGVEVRGVERVPENERDHPYVRQHAAYCRLQDTHASSATGGTLTRARFGCPRT